MKYYLVLILIALGRNSDLFNSNFGNINEMFKEFDKELEKTFKNDSQDQNFEGLFPMSFDFMLPSDLIKKQSNKTPVSEFEKSMEERANKINKISQRHQVFKKLRDNHESIKKSTLSSMDKMKALDSLNPIIDEIKNKDIKTERIVKNYKDGTHVEILQKTVSPHIQMVVEKIEHLSKPLLKSENEDSLKHNLKDFKEIQSALHNKNGVLDPFFSDFSFFNDSFESIITNLEKDFHELKEKKSIPEDHSLMKDLDDKINQIEKDQSHIKLENLRNIHKHQQEMVNLQKTQNEKINNIIKIENGIKNEAELKKEKVNDIKKDLNHKDITLQKKREVEDILSVLSE